MTFMWVILVFLNIKSSIQYTKVNDRAQAYSTNLLILVFWEMGKNNCFFKKKKHSQNFFFKLEVIGRLIKPLKSHIKNCVR